VAGGLALGVVILLGLAFGVPAYLRSERFRQVVNRETGQFLGVTGEFMPLHWSGFSAYSDGFAGRGATHSLRADRIRAEFYPRGIFRRAWQITDLEVQQLTVRLGEPFMEPGTTKGAGLPGWWAAWLPDRLELARVRIENVGVHWPTGALQQVRAVITPDGAGWIVEGTGGQFRQAGYPPVAVERVKLRYRDGEVWVTDSALRLEETAALNVTGTARTEAVDLQVAYQGVAIAPWLPEDWRARLKGTATGHARVTGPTPVRVAGRLELVGGQLVALPVLERIAAFTRTTEFRQLTLQTARTDYVWEGDRLRLREVVLESAGLLRVEGGCEVVAGRLAGEFRVGVTPGALRWLPGSQARVFTEERAGYAWTTVKVTGPVDRLEEDLSARLIAAAGKELIEGVRGTVEEGARDLLELLRPLVP
jgi:hypothetical protein